MRKNLNKSGFTLIELMAVAGIFTLVTSGILSLLSSGMLSVDTNEAQIQATQSGRLAMEQVKRELRLSQAGKLHIYDDFITRSSGIGGDPIAGPVAYFQLPVGVYDDSLISYLNADNSLQWGSEQNQIYNLGGYVYYYLDLNSGHLRRAVCENEGEGLNGAGRAIATNISSITFSRGSETSDLIDIQISAQARANPGRIITHTVHSSVRLRN